MSIALINTKVAEAIAAAEGGDYATGLTKLESAKALLSVLPTSEAHDTKFDWDRTALDSLIVQYQRKANASVGIQRSKLRYRRPTSSCD